MLYLVGPHSKGNEYMTLNDEILQVRDELEDDAKRIWLAIGRSMARKANQRSANAARLSAPPRLSLVPALSLKPGKYSLNRTVESISLRRGRQPVTR